MCFGQEGKSAGHAEGEIESFLQTAEKAKEPTSQSVPALGEALLARAAVQQTEDELAPPRTSPIRGNVKRRWQK